MSGNGWKEREDTKRKGRKGNGKEKTMEGKRREGREEKDMEETIKCKKGSERDRKRVRQGKERQGGRGSEKGCEETDGRKEVTKAKGKKGREREDI